MHQVKSSKIIMYIFGYVRKEVTIMKKILSLLMVLMLVFAFTACGSSEEAETEDSGQNPVMNFIGNYVRESIDPHKR